MPFIITVVPRSAKNLASVFILVQALGSFVLSQAILPISENFPCPQISSCRWKMCWIVSLWYFGLLKIMRHNFSTTLLNSRFHQELIFNTLWRGKQTPKNREMETWMFKQLAQRLIQGQGVSKRKKLSSWWADLVLKMPWGEPSLQKYLHGQHLHEQMFYQTYCTAKPTLAYLFLSAFIMLWGSSMIRPPIWYLY